MILKHFTKNNENHKNPFPSRFLRFGQLHTCTDVEASICGQGGSPHTRPALASEKGIGVY